MKKKKLDIAKYWGNETKGNDKVSPVRVTIITTTKDTKFCEGHRGKKESLYTVKGNRNGKQYEESLKILQMELPCDLVTPFLGNVSKGNEVTI